MNKNINVLHRVAAILAVTAASYGLPAHAQTAGVGVSANASVSSTSTRTTSTLGQKVDKGIEATKNTARKTGEFTKDVAQDAAAATRRTGNKIAEKIPGTEANARVNAEAGVKK